ncbi:ABC transporter ATP-binding protein [Salinimonas sp. HHU 13199]|uniref:ABC transporter ATP-binding protein n=1 Tax=Salinimonas profundi TaxID=2729140 RepID=A0ABR8LTA8_9ALTE|nr:hypothetical protein [Salinimonas profundi]MBD3587374.1 ABC transporter ATP-binding protein [Salinimonas profundi]
MEGILEGVGAAGALFYLALIILWVLVPVFVILISKRVKEMRDIAIESRIEIKELNASLKYLKRKFNESDDS